VRRGADRQRVAVFQRISSVPDIFRIKVIGKNLMVAPFSQDVVTVTVTTADLDRPDPIGTLVPCILKQQSGSRVRIKCKEPEI